MYIQCETTTTFKITGNENTLDKLVSLQKGNAELSEKQNSKQILNKICPLSHAHNVENTKKELDKSQKSFKCYNTKKEAVENNINPEKIWSNPPDKDLIQCLLYNRGFTNLLRKTHFFWVFDTCILLDSTDVYS